jgi:hypothetical protein
LDSRNYDTFDLEAKEFSAKAIDHTGHDYRSPVPDLPQNLRDLKIYAAPLDRSGESAYSEGVRGEYPLRIRFASETGNHERR